MSDVSDVSGSPREYKVEASPREYALAASPREYAVEASPREYAVLPEPGGVVVLSEGFQGPRGPPGPTGPAGVSYLYAQPAPSSAWTVNHNLGFSPVVEVRGNAGNVVSAGVDHLSANTTLISFSVPFSGTARFI